MVTAPARIVPSHAAPADPMSLVRPVAVGIVDVWKSFGATTVLKGVSVTIGKGEFFSLLGPSGCGKTTLLRMIGGFEAPTAGEIRIDGKDVGGLPPYARATNMIFQQLALFPHLDVFENVAFGLRVQKHPKGDIAAKVKEALALVRLEGFERRMPDQLSGGQRQRVAMARAIVNEPSVLLLDEPLGALDLQLRLQMHEELRRLQRTLGNTFVFVTHDQSEAMAMSDRIAVMNAGEIIQIGTPEEIYEQPKSRFVAQFVGHTNLFDGKVVAAEGQRVTVDCAGTPIVAHAARPVERGSDVTVAVRFERIGLGAKETTIEGRVVERMFLGGAVRLVIGYSDDRRMTADIATNGVTPSIAVGEPIAVGFNSADARVLTS